MKSICFFAGSFDPFTIGHLHVVKNASILYNKVYIGIGTNPEKIRTFDKKEMKKVIEITLEEEKLNNVEVVIYEGNTVDIAMKLNVTHFIRGIRNGKDYEYEKQVANYNLEYSGIKTMYIGAEEYEKVSSTEVRNLIKNNKDIDEYVPKAVKELIKKVKL